ncbi:restriction endonuclease subunit S [Schlegelella aquatica]|uniref:restriction endonuclease subunit S n=1 Tax=Caldimonas aquatica TaxID=376175 RepID=UPI00375094A5
MAGEWRACPLGEVIELKRGYDLPQQDRRHGPVPVVSSSGVIDHHTQAMVKGPGVITGRYGTLGQVFYIERDFWPLNTTLYVRDFKGNDPRFISYFLRCLDFLAYSDKAAVPGLNRNHLHQARVIVPTDVAEQRAIAYILGTLDDKIELNRRMSETLEAMARALFKAWFVDFEPVRAKMEGRWRRGETLPGLPAHLYDLFPDRLVDSELGEIPEGWGVKRAGDLFEVAIGKTPPRKEHQWFSTDPQDIPWMSIKDLGQSGVFISQVSEYLTPAAVERFRVRRIPDETVVLSFKLTVGRVAITDGEMLSNEAIAHFLPCEETFLGAAYLYCYLRQFDYESLGSTSSIATAVNSDSVRAIPILVPSEEAHEGFARATWASFLRLRALERESRTLAALRDTLLPKLISGELRVKDAETFLERVAA